jgi:hypothetical protein
VVGVVQRRDTGRPEIAYGRRCPQDKIEHEVRVADLAIIFKDWPFIRGLKVGNAEPDGVMNYKGRRCSIEVDNSGKMTVKQMAAKWRRFGDVEGFILVVAMTEGRMQRLRNGAELVKNAALFTTFERLRSGQPWIDFEGNPVKI